MDNLVIWMSVGLAVALTLALVVWVALAVSGVF